MADEFCCIGSLPSATWRSRPLLPGPPRDSNTRETMWPFACDPSMWPFAYLRPHSRATPISSLMLTNHYQPCQKSGIHSTDGSSAQLRYRTGHVCSLWRQRVYRSAACFTFTGRCINIMANISAIAGENSSTVRTEPRQRFIWNVFSFWVQSACCLTPTPLHTPYLNQPPTTP